MSAQTVFVGSLIDLLVFGNFLPTKKEDDVEAFSFFQLHVYYVLIHTVFLC